MNCRGKHYERSDIFLDTCAFFKNPAFQFLQLKLKTLNRIICLFIEKGGVDISNVIQGRFIGDLK